MIRVLLKPILLAVALLGVYVTQNAFAQNAPLIYKNISFPKLPWASRWVEVGGLKMHYIETGDPKGEPIVFLHGVPTWLYLWRDVIPAVQANGRRIIALDLIGFGRSDKPISDNPASLYSIPSEARFFEGFVDALGLKSLTLVIQDLGSAIGFDYAARHEANVKGIVFMESAIPVLFPPTPEAFKLMDANFVQFLNGVIPAGQGEEILQNQNAFIEQLLPTMMMHKLSPAELDAYRAPFPEPKDRASILWGGPRNFVNKDTLQLIANYSTWLPTSNLPKLMLYVEPGAITPKASVAWAKANLKNLQSIYLGPGGHFVQEDYPKEIGQTISEWLKGQGR